LTAQDVFRRIVEALQGAGIPYMLTGSFASSYHGTPRSTQDIDIVIAPSLDQVRDLVKLLPESEYYVDEDAAVDAQKRAGQFNVIDFATGWKVDLIVRKARPFSRTEFDRREFVDFRGLNLAIATAEDVVIAKLEWAKVGESQRQVDDAAGILKTRAGLLDLEYLRGWVHSLGLQEQWNAACRAAGVPSS
jgi:hypothetical protein